MKRHSWWTIALACTSLTLAACAAKTPVAPPPPPTVAVSTSQTPGGGVVEQTVTVTAAVKSVDQKNRKVTLKGPDGELTTINVPDQVRNLAQVKRGDLVTAVFYESIAYQLRKKGTAEPGVVESVGADRAAPGERPGAGTVAAITVTAKITGIDRKTNTVTLKGPEGNTAKVKVKDPSRLEGVKVGDLVDITYTEAVAISVEPAPKK